MRIFLQNLLHLLSFFFLLLPRIHLLNQIQGQMEPTFLHLIYHL